MRLRYLFFLAFCLVALVPLVLFWKLPYSKALEYELEDVKQRHLVIANNLAGAFERYYVDVTSLFTSLDTDANNKRLENLFANYDFQSIMLVSKSGAIKKCLYNEDHYCPMKIDKDILLLAKKHLKGDSSYITTVTEDKSVNSGPILLVVKKVKNDLLIGYLSTRYIISMGKRVSFGEKGHAAIVDQEGNVLAHPLDSWVKERKNISKVSTVQKMLEGKTGVELFYSPALKDDMISGYTAVPKANWGVMIPQPLKELKTKAEQINDMAMAILFLAISLGIIIVVPLSYLFIKPIERLSITIKQIDTKHLDTKLNLNVSKYLPLEIKELKNGFLKLMRKIDDDKRAISQLAYIDVNTSLPNRNYFYELTKQSLLHMKEQNQKGALVFIDFDGFKNVNDTYGHRAGDELLGLFANEITKHFSLCKELNSAFKFDSNKLPDVIPARLGGDEFVILFKNIKDMEEIKIKIYELFEKVFIEYSLYGGIKLKLNGSAGVACFPKDGKKYKDLLRAADIAMYDAKKSGKNTIRFFEKED